MPKNWESAPALQRAQVDVDYLKANGFTDADIANLTKNSPDLTPVSGGLPGSFVGDVVGGLVRGAGSIGATIARPFETSAENQSRRQRVTDNVVSAGEAFGFPVNPNSFLFKASKMGGEIAGTAGAPGAVAGLAARAAPSVAAAAPSLFSAIKTAGMTTGTDLAGAGFGAKAVDMGTRAAGAGAAGGASAGLVDPKDAASGAVFGALTPPALKATGNLLGLGGKAAAMSGAEFTNIFKSDPQRGAEALIKALDLTPDQLPAVIQKLKGAQTLVPGSNPTVSQVLSSPQSALLERVVASSPGGSKVQEALLAQAEARMDALKGVAPVDPNGFSSARQATGDAISKFARAEHDQARSAADAMYKAIDPEGVIRINLPMDSIRGEVQKFTGPGFMGQSGPVTQALKTIEAISPKQSQSSGQLLTGAQPEGASWDSVMRLRAGLNDSIIQAKNNGDKQVAGALGAIKAKIDEQISRASSGALQPGEVFPKGAGAQWREANASWANMSDRFNNGPQASILQTRNGIPVSQGGEVSQLFWANRPGLAEDVKSFTKLVGDNPSMLGQFRSMVTTQGAATAAQGEQLGKKFVDWTRNMLPGLRNAFSPQQVQTLQNIAADIERAATATKAGQAGVAGSTTYQNAANALDVGLIGSPTLSQFVKRIPVVGTSLDAMRAGAAEAGAKQRAALLSGLLTDPQGAATALANVQPSAFRQGVSIVRNAATAPVGGVTLADLLRQGAYRFPSAVAGQQ